MCRGGETSTTADLSEGTYGRTKGLRKQVLGGEDIKSGSLVEGNGEGGGAEVAVVPRGCREGQSTFCESGNTVYPVTTVEPTLQFRLRLLKSCWTLKSLQGPGVPLSLYTYTYLSVSSLNR